MSYYFVTESQTDIEMRKAALSKARSDIEEILEREKWVRIQIPAWTKDRAKESPIEKLKTHKKIYNIWINYLRSLKKGDVLLVQFPLIEQTIYLATVFRKLRYAGIHPVLLLHDLETMRIILRKDKTFKEKIRLRIEEESCLRSSEKIIVHNRIMKEKLKKIVPYGTKMIPLEIFDYLIPDFTFRQESLYKDFRTIIIAGNLRPHKAQYVYHLPDNMKVNLYGIGYQGKTTSTIHYHGSFFPEELPNVMEGGFGLVWDGDSIDTCSGVYGEYLRINNPHKTSLYLASGIPVIIWKQAALADFIEKNQCGITVESIPEAVEKVNTISFEEYINLKSHAESVGEKLRDGFFLKRAVKMFDVKNWRQI